MGMQDGGHDGEEQKPKIGHIFACGWTTKDGMAKRTPGMDSGNAVCVYTSSQGMFNGRWGCMMVDMMVRNKNRKLDTFLLVDGQPRMGWPKGHQGWIQGMQYVYIPPLKACLMVDGDA